MESEVTLVAQSREILGKKVKSLRQEKKIPAVVYGQGKAIPIVLNEAEFIDVFEKVGESAIFDLKYNDSKVKVLIKDYQTDPISTKFLHVDFYKVKMTEKITAAVPLEYVGKSDAVENEDGTLVKNVSELDVKALPADLPREIKIDISSLKTFEDVIKIKDLSIPGNVEIDANPEDVIATVTPPRSEEELAALDEEVTEDVEGVEGVEKEEEKLEATESEAAAAPEKKEEAEKPVDENDQAKKGGEAKE